MIDISEIGCRIIAEESLPEGTVIGTGFNLPDTEHSVNWTGVIRWSVARRGDEGHFVFGVEFTQTPEDELEILQDILASMPDSARL